MSTSSVPPRSDLELSGNDSKVNMNFEQSKLHSTNHITVESQVIASNGTELVPKGSTTSYICKMCRGVRDVYNDLTKSVTYLLISAAYSYFTSYLSYSSIYASNKYLSIVMTLFLSWAASGKIGCFIAACVKKCFQCGAHTASHTRRHNRGHNRGHNGPHALYTGVDGDVEVKVAIASVGFVLELMELITLAGIILSVLQHDTYHTVIFSLSFTFNLISLVSSLWSMRKGNRVPAISCLTILKSFVGLLSVPFIILGVLATTIVIIVKGTKNPDDVVFILKTVLSPLSFIQKRSDELTADSVPYFKSHGKRCYESFYWY